MTLGGRATGLLVGYEGGWPTKFVEGTPHILPAGGRVRAGCAARFQLHVNAENMGEIFPWSASFGAMRTASTLQLASKAQDFAS